MILIIGAGLSGLLTAYRLKKESIPFKVLEARSRIGGRINTVYGTNDAPIEMGATWFDSQHKHLIALLAELGIDYFEQYMDGTVFFQPSSTSPAQSIQIPSQPPSYRISGGTSHLIHTLYQKLDKNDVLLNQPVKEIKFSENSVQVTANEFFEGNAVVLSIPPKMWVNKILFDPQLPNNIVNIAKQTHTWMEDSIKVALTYTEPFWQQENLSGTLFCNTGPITELYDHCNHQRSKYALCGFVNPAYKNLSNTERQAAVIHQMKSVFGTKVEAYLDYKECIWSQEKYTSDESPIPLYPHQNNGNPIFGNSFFNDKLMISSSEVAIEFPGYMDGAVLAANVTAKKITTANNVNE
jgi:monoamine oxidase